MAARFTRLTITAVFVTFALWMLTRLQHTSPPPPPASDVESPAFEAWGIQRLNEEITVSTIHVYTKFEPGFQQPIIQEADINFEFSHINLTETIKDLPAGQVTLTVPTYQTLDASSLVFGIATKLDRLRDALPAFEQWAAGTGAKIVAIVEPESPKIPTKAEIIALWKKHEMEIVLIESTGTTWQDQFVMLLGAVSDNMRSKHEWGIVMDDDTYFFSMKRVLEMLTKYDPGRSYYIGGASENKESWDRIGFFAYGGAGIFLSRPLLERLRPHVDQCVAIDDPGGDTRLNTCIMNFTTTKFTPDYSLFQMDLHGDVSGFYEAPRQRPTSTHHWKSWHHYDMPTLGSVGSVCGSECVLQKLHTVDDYYITNGFSVVKYSYTQEEIESHVEGAMEHTWEHTAWVIPTSWKYTLYPLKPRDPGKIQYIMEKVDEDEKSKTLYYVKRKDGRGDSIIRMVWQKTVQPVES